MFAKTLLMTAMLLTFGLAVATPASAIEDPFIVCVTEPCGPQPPQPPQVGIPESLDHFLQEVKEFVDDNLCTKITC